MGFLSDRKMGLKRPYSKLEFGPFLKLTVEKVVAQKVQQLSKFLSDDDGWPFKSKLLSWFIKLQLNDTNFLLMSAYFSASFCLKHRKIINFQDIGKFKQIAPIDLHLRKELTLFQLKFSSVPDK